MTGSGRGRGAGHNRGPSLEPGAAWRRHCWTRARAELLPVLPLEVVRLRVARAAELGLDYRTYAGVRAATGHDLVALLFSSNALRLLPPDPALPPDRARALGQVRGAARAALVHPPLDPADALALAAPHLDRAAPAPRPFAPWAAVRGAVLAAIAGWPADRVLMIGDTAEERTWSEAGRLAGYLPAARWFPA